MPSTMAHLLLTMLTGPTPGLQDSSFLGQLHRFCVLMQSKRDRKF